MPFAITCMKNESNPEIHSWSREVQVWGCTDPTSSTEFHYATVQEALADMEIIPKDGCIEGTLKIMEIE